ncbi:hypothetical protein MCOR25_009425 [Pyricularia grisea]|nr:hypothetical protein MCOR25_009425 [Pyricularia grisea]
MITRRSPTCLGCLRRALAPSINGSSSNNASVALTQVRGKTKAAREKDEEGGVVVRLLQNVPEYGPKNTILRAPRGRVRNVWYPGGKVEYMTPQRFTELGVDQSVIVERDPMFGLEVEKPVEKKKVAKAKTANDKVVKIEPPKVNFFPGCFYSHKPLRGPPSQPLRNKTIEQKKKKKKS